MILSEEGKAAFQGEIAVSVKGSVGIKHAKILDGVFGQTRKAIGAEALKAVVPMGNGSVGEVRGHPPQVVGDDLNGRKHVAVLVERLFVAGKHDVGKDIDFQRSSFLLLMERCCLHSLSPTFTLEAREKILIAAWDH
jgi:hypothetical protein